MHGDVHANVVEDLMLDGHRLLVGIDQGDQTAYLRNDGTWVRTDRHAAMPSDAGLALPRGVWDAICAIAVPSHGAAEVRRLEEALAVERHRVDFALGLLEAGQGGRTA